MLDTSLRPLIDRPLQAAGSWLADRGVRANAVTLAGLVVGLLAAVAIAYGEFTAGFLLILANRVLDGLDGAVARRRGATEPTTLSPSSLHPVPIRARSASIVPPLVTATVAVGEPVEPTNDWGLPQIRSAD